MNNKKLLIVEEEEVMAKALVDKFTKEEFEVVLANDGEEGLRLALDKKPDLVLLDIILPKMDGMTMMKKLRESGQFGKTVPIILLTNLNIDDNIMKGVVENEPAYYLVKTDWPLDSVVDKVKERLEMVESQQE